MGGARHGRGVGGPLPLPLAFRGKVRDVYEVGGHADPARLERPPEDHLLLVATDRASAFDVVMDEPVPDKGRVLTQITAWWLRGHLADVPHHLVSVRDDEIRAAVPALAGREAEWAGRASLVRRTRPLPVECVVRGRLAGSAWAEYRASGTLAGEELAPGLAESGPLRPAVFSPATKAGEGHDENITFAEMAALVGEETARRLRELSLRIFRAGRAAAAERGIILADTKFEFGVAPDGGLLLIDEALTPDSSRFWPRDGYRPGRPQPALDKQPLRDYLDGLAGWDKRPPPPPLPDGVVAAMARRYRDAFARLTGTALDDWEPPRMNNGFAPATKAAP